MTKLEPVEGLMGKPSKSDLTLEPCHWRFPLIVSMALQVLRQFCVTWGRKPRPVLWHPVSRVDQRGSNEYFRADLNVLAAFSSYCLGDYEGALRLISEVPGEKHADTPILGYKILYLCALGSVRDAAQAAQQYVVRFGRLRTPHRQALGDAGIDADSLYLTYKCEESSIRSS